MEEEELGTPKSIDQSWSIITVLLQWAFGGYNRSTPLSDTPECMSIFICLFIYLCVLFIYYYIIIYLFIYLYIYLLWDIIYQILYTLLSVYTIEYVWI